MIAARGRPTHEQTLSAEAIKQVAWQQMAARGSAGLALRPIARDLGVTAPALYNYFPRLDDLITALVVDAFTDSAAAMISAANDAAGASGRALPAVEAMLLAYREWAVRYPVRFALIYGSPIPGYEAPAEVTIPLAARPFLALMEHLARAWEQGEIGIPPEYTPAPAATEAHLQANYPDLAARVPLALGCLLLSSWARMHGLILLELYGHLGPVAADTEAYSQYEIHSWLRRLVACRPAHSVSPAESGRKSSS
ncbi:MAG: TetR/AcrR family transcriptional regulator [Caldilineaceae bacterium]